MFTNGNTAMEGGLRSRPVERSSIEVEAGRAIVADSDVEAAPATRRAPSTRQNFRASFVSTRLQVGQCFISELQLLSTRNFLRRYYCGAWPPTPAIRSAKIANQDYVAGDRAAGERHQLPVERQLASEDAVRFEVS